MYSHRCITTNCTLLYCTKPIMSTYATLRHVCSAYAWLEYLHVYEYYSAWKHTCTVCVCALCIDWVVVVWVHLKSWPVLWRRRWICWGAMAMFGQVQEFQPDSKHTLAYLERMQLFSKWMTSLQKSRCQFCCQSSGERRTHWATF